MNGFFKICLAAYMFAGLISASPLASYEPPEQPKRDASGEPTVYTYITQTVTVSPPDVTRTTYAYEVPVYTTTVHTTVTDGCTRYSYVNMKQRRAAATTVTLTTDATVTVTSTGVPTRTVCTYEAIAYVTQTGPYTSTHTLCTNTLVASWITAATITSTAYIWSSYTQITVTDVCMTTVYPPGWFSSTLESGYTPPPNPFESTTLATTSLYENKTIWTSVTGNVETIYTSECNNPTLTFTNTYYTQTITPYTIKTVLATDCDKTATPTNGCAAIVARSIPGEIPAAEMTKYLVRHDGLGPEAAIATTITTPITMVQTFTDIFMVGATVTATVTDTWTSSVCSLPTSSIV